MSEHGQEVPTPRRRRKLLKFVAVSLILCLLAIAVLFFYLRSERFNRYIANQIEIALLNYGLRAEVGGFEFSWYFDRTQLRNVKLYNPKTNQFIVSAERATLIFDIPDLYALQMQRNVALKKIQLDGVEISLDTDEHDNSNVGSIHAPPPSGGESNIKVDISNLLIALNRCHFKYYDHHYRIGIELHDLNVDGKWLPDKKVADTHVTIGPGNVDIQGYVTQLKHVDFKAQAGADGVSTTDFIAYTERGTVTAYGYLNEWLVRRFRFDAEVNTTDPITNITDGVYIKGAAKFKGFFEGVAANYHIQGDFNTDEMVLPNHRLIDVKITNMNLTPHGKLDFTADAIHTRNAIATYSSTANTTLHQVVGLLEGNKVTTKVARATTELLKIGTGNLYNVQIVPLQLNTEGSLIKATANAIQLSKLTIPATEINGINIKSLSSQFFHGKYQASGSVTTSDGKVLDAPFTNAQGNMEIDNQAVRFQQFNANLMGGNADFELSLALYGTTELKADLHNWQTGELTHWFANKDLPYRGLINGKANVNWPGLTVTKLNGDVNATIKGDAAPTKKGIPLDAELDLHADNGILNFHRFHATSSVISGDAKGELALVNGESNLKFEISSSEAQRVQELILALDFVEKDLLAYNPQIDGAVTMKGAITGRYDDPTIIGNVEIEKTALNNQPLGDLKGKLTLSPQVFQFEDAVLRTAKQGELKFNYQTSRTTLGENGRFDGSFSRLDVTLLNALFPINGRITGLASGEAHLQGLFNNMQGEVRINLIDGTIFEQAADSVETKLIFDSDTIKLIDTEARLQSGKLLASATLNLKTNQFELNSRIEKVDLMRLKIGSSRRISGIVDAELSMRGDRTKLDTITVDVNVRAEQFKVDERLIGDVGLKANSDRNGKIRLELNTAILSSRAQLINIDIGLADKGLPITIDTDLNDFDLAPLIAIASPQSSTNLAGRVSGLVRVSGPLLNSKDEITIEQLRGTVSFSELLLQISGRTIKVQTPLNIVINNSQITIDHARFIGTGINLTMDGAAGLQLLAPMKLNIMGGVDLKTLPTDLNGVNLGGIISAKLNIAGTLGEPKLLGVINLRNLSFATPSFPIAIENGTGNITFDGEKAVMENFTARANNAALQGSGRAKLVGLYPSEWQLDLMSSDLDLIQEGILATISGHVSLNGTPQEQYISGDINVRQAEYITNFDLGTLTAGGKNSSFSMSGFSNIGLIGATGSLSNRRFSNIKLDIHINANNSFIFRNKQVNTIASASITIGGKLSEPELSGRISFDGGTIKFRGQRYDINMGTLDLNGGNANTPLANLLAEGSISNYRVYIRLTGPLDQLDLDLQSEPNLTRAEILSLITTGRTDTSSLNSNNLGATGVGTAASFLTDELISKPFGRGAEQFLGFNRFQIDPVLRPNSDPSARLTLGRQITRDLALTFATSLTSDKDQTIILEYNLSNRFSALGTFSQGNTSTRGVRSDNDFTIEARGRERFSFRKNSITSPTLNLDTLAKPLSNKFPKAEVVVATPGDIKLRNSKLRELLPIKKQGFSFSLSRLGERNLINYLQEQGYFFARVKTSCDPYDCVGPDLIVRYEVVPGLRYDLKEIRLVNSKVITLHDVKGDLESKEKSVISKVPLFNNLPLVGGYARGLTSDDRIERDRELIRNKLVELGYRDAKVDSRFEVLPNNQGLVLLFDVQDGALARIKEIDIRGTNVMTVDRIRKELDLKEDEEFSPTRSLAAARQIKNYYGKHGYLDAIVDTDIEDLPDNGVRLVYEVEEGSEAIVREILIKGELSSSEKSIFRYLDFKTGELITSEKITRTQRDLYATGNYREVNIKTEKLDNSNDQDRRVIIYLTEAKPLLLSYGLGYSTDEGPKGLIELTNTNLFGRLNTGSIRLRASGIEQVIQAQYTDLRPFNSRWAITLSAFYNNISDTANFSQQEQRRFNDSISSLLDFGLDRFVGFIQTERKWNDTFSVRFRYNIERVRLNNLIFTNTPSDLLNSRLGILTGGLSYDTRNNPFTPNKGQLITFDYSVADKFIGSEQSFNKVVSNYQRFQSLKKLPGGDKLKDSVLAFSLRLGLANTFREQPLNFNALPNFGLLPISERFFSGGATTLRGFEFERAGPQLVVEPAGQPPSLISTGGNALTVVNFEFRYPITRRLQLVPFYDLGNVFANVRDINFANMTNSIGLGLRFNTPIGPVGIDYGYLLDPPAFITSSGGFLRQKRGVFHIKLGQSF